MQNPEETCPICGICTIDLSTHLQQHSKDELIMAYSCKPEPNTSVCSKTPMNNVATTSSSEIPTIMQQASTSQFAPNINGYNTFLIPMNPSNCSVPTLSQPVVSMPMQAKPPYSNIRFPNILPLQNPLICMPQSMYPNFMNPNMPPFQTPLKEAPGQVKLAAPTLNIVEPTRPESSSTPKVVQQQSYIANTGFPTLQQSPYQMPVFPFYSPAIGANPANYSLYGNNLYSASPMPTVVQFPGFNAAPPICASGMFPQNMQTTQENLNPISQNLNVSVSEQSNESINANEIGDQDLSDNKQSVSPQLKQCYYLGDREALVSIGDDVKLILPKDILSKEEVLGEFLRQQLATAIATEVKSDTGENNSLEQNVDQNQVLIESPELCSPHASLTSPNKCDKTMKIENKAAADLKTARKNEHSKQSKYILDHDKEYLGVFEDEHILGTIEEVFSVEGHQIKQCSISESEFYEDNNSTKPRVIKMFSRNGNSKYSNIEENNLASGKGIKCVSQITDAIFTEQSNSLLGNTDIEILDIGYSKNEACKYTKYDSNDGYHEEKLSLKSSETLDHSDSESPTFMENTLQDLICIEEPGIHAMSPQKKSTSSEFRISNSQDHHHLSFGLDSYNTVPMSPAFIPDLLSPVKASSGTEMTILKGENAINSSSIDAEFLEPFASTSGLQNKHSAMNKSMEYEEYDFDYESDYFDSDSEIFQGHKHGLLFQWKCSKCQKSFKSLKEKLLHSGCHIDEMNVRRDIAAEKKSPVKVENNELNTEEEMCGDSKKSIIEVDDVIKQRIELLRNPLACSLCFVQFPDQTTASQHMKTHSISELKCSTCNKQIKSFCQWVDHQLFHYGASKHDCKYCGKKFERRALLNIHVRKHTGQRPYKCVTCMKKFAVRGSLKAHMLTHLKSEDVECDFCLKKFKNFSCMVRHKGKHHLQKKQTTFKKKLDYLCSTCNLVFHTERKLLWHQETHKRWPSKCNYCGDCFVHQSGLTKHIRLKHNAKHVPDGERKGSSLACVVCNKMYTSSSLALHMRTHNGYKPYKCLVCAKLFSVKCNLDNHMWVHAGAKDRPFRCSLCDKSYSRKKFLEAHVRSHRKIKPYTCNECGKAFAYKNNLNSHIKDHFGEKQHLCSYCGKAFFRKYNLKDHVRIHTGETPYSCTICNKEFTQKSNYNVHIKAFHVERHVLDEEV